jgi:hypothetical protein
MSCPNLCGDGLRRRSLLTSLRSKAANVLTIDTDRCILLYIASVAINAVQAG